MNDAGLTSAGLQVHPCCSRGQNPYFLKWKFYLDASPWGYALHCCTLILMRWLMNAAAAAKLFQSCPTLCDPIDGSPLGFSVPGILQARVGCHFLLQCMKVKSESEVVQSCLTLSNPMDCSLPGSSIHGFSRQEYWSG